MKKNEDEKDNPKYLNYLFLQTLLQICRISQLPKNVTATIEAIADLHAYDIPVRLRREANDVGLDFAEKIVSSYEETIEDMDGEDNDSRGWDDGLVSAEQAEANKELWRAALAAQQVVEIRYVSDTSGEALRRVMPTGIRGPYGDGYCFLRSDDRVFRFDRMLQARIAS